MQRSSILLLCWLLVCVLLLYPSDARKLGSNKLRSGKEKGIYDVFKSLVTNGDVSIRLVDKNTHLEWKQQKRLEKTYAINKTPEEECAEEVNKLTATYLHDYPYKQMVGSSGNDIADLGDREACLALGTTRYYVFSTGIKQLPLEIRVGYCMPAECTPQIMNNAMDKMTEETNAALGPLLDDPPVELPTDVVPEFYFKMVSPEHWKDEEEDDKSTAASMMLGIVIALGVLVAVGTVYENFNQKAKAVDTFKKYKQMSSNMDHSGTNDNEETKVATESSGFPMGGRINLSDKHSNTSINLIEDPKDVEAEFIQPYSDLYKRPLSGAILSSFSLQVNCSYLTTSRRNPDEHEELEIVEGFRVLTMMWGIFCATSLYVLTAHIDNIWYMLELFKSITFTMCASGNLSPNLFLFFIAFLGFYKISVLVSKLNGMRVSTYMSLIGYRIIKYAPIYYFIFLLGWSTLYYISDASTWYLSETLFSECDKYWWSTMLFINNYYPWFTQALNGCYYWPFVIVCDLQLYLLLPLAVVLFRHNKVIFNAVIGLFFVGGMIALFVIFWENNLSVGALTLENYYLYSQNFNKAYTKFPSYTLGIWFACFYMQLLEYRKSQNKEEYKLIHWLHTSRASFGLLLFWSAFALNFTTLVPFEVNKDGYAWTRLQNSIYNALCQFGYVSSVMAIMTMVFTGRMHLLKSLLGASFWRPLSRVTIIAYLLYPIVIMRSYVGTTESSYLRIMDVVYSTIQNIVITYILAVFFYLILQGPVSNIIRILISRIKEYEAKSYLYVKEEAEINYDEK